MGGHTPTGSSPRWGKESEKMGKKLMTAREKKQARRLYMGMMKYALNRAERMGYRDDIYDEIKALADEMKLLPNRVDVLKDDGRL